MKKLPGKGIIALGILLVLFTVANLIFGKVNSQPVKFGVTFTPKYAQYLELDWQETYIQMLDNLHVRSLRLSSFWDILEPERGEYDFAETDYLLAEAGKRDAKVILVVG
ncbi:MAG: beta-galactosidase, partial [Candidatus Daviesbacteria bacterium]|nr:beta-galactosidase [Candidatus Daviesbacteria bacterium]